MVDGVVQVFYNLAAFFVSMVFPNIPSMVLKSSVIAFESSSINSVSLLLIYFEFYLTSSYILNHYSFLIHWPFIIMKFPFCFLIILKIYFV